jgi:hypothetical protein
MSASDSTSPPSDLWVVEKADTGEWLGTRDRRSDGGTAFGARVPLFYGSMRTTRDMWMRYSCKEGYIVRGITLAGSGPQFKPGPNFAAWPRVKFRNLMLVDQAVAVDTPEEMGLVT